MQYALTEADLSSFNHNGWRNWHLPVRKRREIEMEAEIEMQGGKIASISRLRSLVFIRNRSPGLQVVAGGSQGRSLPPSG